MAMAAFGSAQAYSAEAIWGAEEDKRWLAPSTSKSVRSKSLQSLTISPNLDALLEFDEQIRAVWTPASPTEGDSSPQSGPTLGLPPPPRRTSRRPALSPMTMSPVASAETTPVTPRAGWTPVWNPYINEGPMGDGLGGDALLWQRPSTPSDSPLGTPKHPFALCVDSADLDHRLHDVSNAQQQPLSSLHQRARAKGKLLTLNEGEMDDDDDRVFVRRRPLLSHDEDGASSRASSCSSTTTHGPASTIDAARISISSTVYPASEVDSHPHAMYHTADTAHRESSFIDILSPELAEFMLPHRRSPSPAPAPVPARKVPATTNFLQLGERSDLIRKNRKLAQVFGQPPGPDAFPQIQDAARKALVLAPLSPLSPTRHHHRAFSDGPESPGLQASWLPALQYMNIHPRRHSAPLSPDDFSLDRPSSPTSFMDLSDDPGSAALPTPKSPVSRRPPSPSAESLFENMTPEEQAEEIRRRKREKLAKLHRFLGSRVPANLVLGVDDAPPALPPLNFTTTAPENDETKRKAWLRRRRSSSAAAFSSTWSDEVDRIKEDLNMREKAINVRRAQKMEKVFGVAPPQTLYHTHNRAPSPSFANPSSHNMVSGWTSPGENHTAFTGLRNPNRSSYLKSSKKTKDHRPGTSESSKALLPKGGSDSTDFHKRTSIVYSHYQDSLNSLNDIIDRDDRESLAELHEYLSTGDMTVPPPHQLQSFTRSPSGDRRLSNASSTKSERRRSLPTRTSIMSLASEYSITPTPRPDATDFQARRRRAAKLTQFFGVDYRELIVDVLESIENGLEHERKRGTLKPDEVEDLLGRLRNLRTKRGT
ncbi:hypothetical protein H0H81_012076 [Sphagnurus paluster]|uniref:Uncharacterized protein n=1 Tax=Sphagnurus paluster TaxID=117069 RepID=A0A9P7GND4_9AGAR|nr:hypothetical protein H0H81_012076 [Sphagnurus paluster]